MLALLAAAVLAAPPPRPAPSASPSTTASGASAMEAYVAKEMAWEKANLDTQGWTLVTVGTAVMIFLGPAPRAPGGDPMVSVRGEHYPFAGVNPIGAGESFLSRDEIDCGKKLERTVSSTIYADNGLQGNIASASDDPGAWSPIKDGAFMAAAEKMVCQSAGSAH